MLLHEVALLKQCLEELWGVSLGSMSLLLRIRDKRREDSLSMNSGQGGRRNQRGKRGVIRPERAVQPPSGKVDRLLLLQPLQYDRLLFSGHRVEFFSLGHLRRLLLRWGLSFLVLATKFRR